MILQVDTNAELRPEENENYELEAGYRISQHSQLTVNLFDNTLTNVLLYADDTSYINSGEFNTRGFEVQYRWGGSQGFVAVNFSRHWLAYAKAPFDDDYYRVYPSELGFFTPINKLVGSAERQIALYGEYRVSDRVSFNPAVIYFGERYSMIYREDLGYTYYDLVPSDVVVNFFVHARDVLTDGFSAALGVTNLNNGDNLLTSLDYSNGYAQRPGFGPRIDLRLNYEF
jgi:outer membrane receptor for monomeric catechols